MAAKPFGRETPDFSREGTKGAASDATGGTSSRQGSRPASGITGSRPASGIAGSRRASGASGNDAPSVERAKSFEEPALATSEAIVARLATSEEPPEDEAAIQPYNQESLQESVSPKNEQVWAASTKTMLGKAKSLRQAAEGELAKTNVDFHEGKQKSEAIGNKNQSQLRKKIDTTHSIARSLWDRTTGTEDTIRHVGHSIFQLSRAQQATSTPLDVITKCIELRKARPLQELVYDHFQKALEEEQAALQFSQKAYQERVDISRGILEELEQAKGLLHSDMLRKRHASRYTPSSGQATERGGPGTGAPSAAGCSSSPHDRALGLYMRFDVQAGPQSFDSFGNSFGTFEDPCPPHTFAVEPLACPAHGYDFNMNCRLCQRSIDNAEQEKEDKEAEWREREAEKRAGRSLPRMPESAPGHGGRYMQSPMPQTSSAYAQTDLEGVGAKNAKTSRPQSAGQHGQCRALAIRNGPGDPGGQHAQQLLAHTHDLCSTAARICTRNEEVLKDRRRDCEVTRKSVVENMRKRMLETAELKKALEQELRDTDNAIGGMGDGLAETERLCSIHNVALGGELNKSEPGLGGLLRKQRTDGEKKGVGRPPEKDETVSNANIRALQEQYKRKRTVLEQMSNVRHQLGDDLRCKVQAFNIDSQCSKLLTRPHTARVGGGPSPPAQGRNGKPPFRRKGNNGVVVPTYGPGSDEW